MVSTSTANPIVVSMNGAKTLVAVFKQNVVTANYTLVLAVQGQGTTGSDVGSYMEPAATM